MKIAWKMVSAGLIVMVAAGCQTTPPDQMRREQAAQFREKVDAATETALKDGAALNLDDCIVIALQNNVAVKSADVQARLATLERRAAFSNFLPALDLNFNLVSWDRQPASKLFGGFAVPMQDQTVREATFQMQMPVFVPATWYMYAMRQRGEDIQHLVAGYVRQGIALRVTALYFHVLAIREARAALESQMASAQALAKQAQAYLAEGVATPSQSHQAELLLQMRENSLQENQRAEEAAVADLLSSMGLSPLSGLSLVATTPLEGPAEPMETLVAQALLAHTELKVADQQAAIQEDAVKLAITQFLPQLFGFANRTSTSNTFTAFPDFTMTGLSGVMSLFHGFANVNAYRAARAQKEAAYLRIEEASFSVMVGVIRAHLNWQDARTALALTQKALEAAESRAREVDAQWREGVLNTSDRLEAAAERDRAQGHVAMARFQEQVAIATLRHVLGGAYLGGVASPAATKEDAQDAQ